MLRETLIKRFHVAVHRGEKEVSGYILTASNGGPKLNKAKSPTPDQGHKAGQAFSNSILPGYIRGRSIDVRTFASLLSAFVDEPVVDGTGLPGTFDVDLHFAQDNDTQSQFPSFSTALEEQLGLKLQAQKVPVQTLVVDSADNEPTPD